MDEEKKINTEISSDNSQEMNSVFTKKVEPVGRFKFAMMGIGSFLLKIILWVANFVLSIFVSLGMAIWAAIKGIYKGILAIAKFFKRKAHQFKYNDIFGRLSFLFWGVGSIGHGQIINGILYFVFEVGYLICFVLFGIGNIGFLFNSTLGTRAFGYDPACQEKWGEAYQTYCDPVDGHNSIMILIFALLWIVSIFVFLYIWNRNINAGYNNYRIKHFSFFKEVDQNNIAFSNHISEEAEKAFNSGVKKGAFRKQIEPEIKEYLANLNGDKLAKSYSVYLIRESISHAYNYLSNVRKENAKLAKLENKKAAAVEKMEAKIKEASANVKDEKDTIKVEKLTNKLTSIIAKHDIKIKKQKHLIDEINKRYSSFAEMQHTRNNDKYGKYNVYFKHVANIDNDLNLYSHYFEYMNLYKATLGKHVDYNQSNVQKGIELRNDTERKIAETKENFNAVRAKREDLKAQIQAAKEEYSNRLKEIRNDSSIADKEKAMADAKLELVEKCTRLNNSLNDLPGESTIKAMEKEEIKEYRHSYLRDKKALKSNFTSESYARQVVLDCMLVEHRIEYRRAVRFVDLMFGSNGAKVNKMNEEDVNKKINALQEERNKYVEEHPDRFVGKPKTFLEQISALFDENFHITILLLPVLGIVMMTILPLLFSIIIAFTNYGEGHLPPNALFGWIGFGNFAELFASDSATSQLGSSLVQTVGWTFLWAFAATFSNYILGIIVALMINKDGIKFKKFWRTIFVLTIAVPQFISLVCISIMLKDGAAVDTIWQWAFGTNLNFAQKDYINITKLIIILVNIWVGIPYTILSTTGILMNIPKDLYESSEVDGANKFTQFFKITMPYILFVTGPYLITQFVGNINNFNVIFFLSTNVKPIAGSVGDIYGLKPTDLLITFLYSLVTNNSHPKFGMASAIGIIIFIICAFFSLIMYGKSGSIQEEDQFQ